MKYEIVNKQTLTAYMKWQHDNNVQTNVQTYGNANKHTREAAWWETQLNICINNHMPRPDVEELRAITLIWNSYLKGKETDRTGYHVTRHSFKGQFPGQPE